MPATNRSIADVLTLTGQIMEIAGENPYKSLAMYRASGIIERLPQDIAGLSRSELVALPGIGEHIADKVIAIASTGTHPELEELRARVPAGVIELLDLDGVGPKTIVRLQKKLSIQSVDDLERAARQRRIRAVPGFGEKKEQAFLKAVARYREGGGRMTRDAADRVIARVSEAFTPGSFQPAGSYRRGRSTIGDIDIVTTEPPSLVNPRIRQLADEMIDEGDQRTSFRCLGSRVDVRFTNAREMGAMMVYLTGSKEFNVRIRGIAASKGLKLNEYGITENETGKVHMFADEEGVFSWLGMDFVPPELRENTGEVEAAISHSLPGLVTREEVRGDLHAHTDWSDGTMTIRGLAEAAAASGLSYILCSDHAASLGITHGLDPERIARQAREIEEVNRDGPCQVLHGIEVDIRPDGTLSLPSAVLADLDIVIASVHTAFTLDEDAMTRRVMTAMEDEHVDIIGHPTGRLLGERDSFAIDLSRVIDHARETGTMLECNTSPWRLDLDDIYIRQAKEKGVIISLGTDSHRREDLAHMAYGVMAARRGWCGPQDIANTLSAGELLKRVS
jgi:DNA polymerase (family 10)